MGHPFPPGPKLKKVFKRRGENDDWAKPKFYAKQHGSVSTAAQSNASAGARVGSMNGGPFFSTMGMVTGFVFHPLRALSRYTSSPTVNLEFGGGGVTQGGDSRGDKVEKLITRSESLKAASLLAI